MTFPLDPRWITARFPSKCQKCKAAVPKGAAAFYYPRTRTLYGKACGCGDMAACEFEAMASDEAGPC